uniref:Uncharacterized protein n=1 Tax=Oryzias latipes TaxID=8090 RepID=A0A3P9JM12_ORYLA
MITVLNELFVTPPLELSPSLWICVVPVIIGSFVILALWCVILRRKGRIRSNSATELELLQKTKTNFHPPVSKTNGQTEMFHSSAEPPLTIVQFHAEAQTGSKWKEDLMVGRGPERQAVPVCSTMLDHRVPLPATELGGTALVTTKTV